MKTLIRRVERLARRQPKRMGPVRVWYSYDDGRPSQYKPTPEEHAAIEAAGGLEIEVAYVTAQHKDGWQ